MKRLLSGVVAMFLAGIAMGAATAPPATAPAVRLGTDGKPADTRPILEPVTNTGNWMQRHDGFVARAKQGNIDLLHLSFLHYMTIGPRGSSEEIVDHRGAAPHLESVEAELRDYGLRVCKIRRLNDELESSKQNPDARTRERDVERLHSRVALAMVKVLELERQIRNERIAGARL